MISKLGKQWFIIWYVKQSEQAARCIMVTFEYHSTCYDLFLKCIGIFSGLGWFMKIRACFFSKLGKWALNRTSDLQIFLTTVTSKHKANWLLFNKRTREQGLWVTQRVYLQFYVPVPYILHLTDEWPYPYLFSCMVWEIRGWFRI